MRGIPAGLVIAIVARRAESIARVREWKGERHWVEPGAVFRLVNRKRSGTPRSRGRRIDDDRVGRLDGGGVGVD
jgi:hypothetical protein